MTPISPESEWTCWRGASLNDRRRCLESKCDKDHDRMQGHCTRSVHSLGKCLPLTLILPLQTSFNFPDQWRDCSQFSSWVTIPNQADPNVVDMGITFRYEGQLRCKPGLLRWISTPGPTGGVPSRMGHGSRWRYCTSNLWWRYHHACVRHVITSSPLCSQGRMHRSWAKGRGRGVPYRKHKRIKLKVPLKKQGNTESLQHGYNLTIMLSYTQMS